MSETTDRLRKALALARRLFTPLAIGFLLLAVWSSRDAFGQVLAVQSPWRLALAVAAWAALHLIAPLTTVAILRGFAVPLPYRVVLGIHVSRLPARYLPGGIWHTVSRAVDLHARGVGKAQLATMVLMENAVPLAAAVFGGGACLWLAGDVRLPGPAIAAAGVAALVALPWVNRRVGRTAALPLPAYLQVVASVALFWAGAAATFAFYLSAFPGARVAGRLLDVVAAYLLSWSAGFLAVFAPQGLGVFESVAGLLLQSALPFASMALLVAGFRACMLSGDALAWSAGWLVRRLQRPA